MEDIRLFISYSHCDREWAEAIAGRSIRTTRGRARLVVDQRILDPGDAFTSELIEAIEQSHGYLLLVSRDFLESEYVSSVEWPQILAQHGRRICWVPIGADGDASSDDPDWRSDSPIMAELERLHAAVDPGAPLPCSPPTDPEELERTVAAIAEAIRRTVDPLGAAIHDELSMRGLVDVHFVAEGLSASVFSAWNEVTERRVAVKVPRKGEARDGFLSGIRDGRELSSIPAFIHLFDANLGREPYYSISDFVDGDTISALLGSSSHEALSPEAIHRLLLKLALALETVYSRGLRYLNVRPSNIIVDRGEPYIAAAPRSSVEFSRREVLDGPGEAQRERLAYLIPEVFEHTNWSAEKVDLYCLGLVGYQLLSGDESSTVGNLDELLADREAEPRFRSLPDIADLRPDCPTALAAIVNQMTALDPSKRQSGFKQLVSALMDVPSRRLATAEHCWAACMDPAGGGDDAFFSAFYERFLGESRGLEQLFPDYGPDWPTDRQRHLLRDAVLDLFRYYGQQSRLSSIPEALNPLIGKARRHAAMRGSDGTKILRGDFATFAESLLTTVQTSLGLDDQDARLADFEAVIEPGIRFMRDEMMRAREQRS